MDDIIKAGVRHYAEQMRKEEERDRQYWESVRAEEERKATEPGWHTRYVGQDHEPEDYYIPDNEWHEDCG